ncbi:MAG: hypothetical protein JNM81_11260 [Rhodospirillaceae bacterium]|nr:hypothetical protein [Rhodospirillaceae bacterium]
MKLPDLKNINFSIPNLPPPVMISASTIAGSLLLFLILYFTLGAAAESAQQQVTRLKADLGSTQGKLKQSKTDYEFVLANQDRFTALMSSDKLIPHTRRTAIRQLQALALETGLTAMNYNFQAVGLQAPDSVATQPKSGDYRVYIETIELSVGAPLDSNIYAFVAAVHDEFPGATVVSEIDNKRAQIVKPEMLNAVSRGEDSKIVEGKIRYSWRTAQKEEPKK